MNVTQALEHASAWYFPEILFCEGFGAMDSERQKNEEALIALRDAFFKEEDPGFTFDIVMDLAQRNRELCDAIGINRLNNMRNSSLARGLSDDDLCRAIAVLQKRRAATVIKQVHGDAQLRALAYLNKPIQGTVFGIDIETTDRYPDRGYIINAGFAVMELTKDAEPQDGEAHFFGLPEQYKDQGVPLENIHHISWSDVEGKLSFRDNKELQKKILKLMCKYPYMAHNAAFEDSWFMYNLDGYAEARKKGKIVVIDSRDICRCLDPEVKSLPRESSPAALENWAKRRHVLEKTDKEVHQGLDDTELMLRTAQAEFALRGCFGSSENA